MKWLRNSLFEYLLWGLCANTKHRGPDNYRSFAASRPRPAARGTGLLRSALAESQQSKTPGIPIANLLNRLGHLAGPRAPESGQRDLGQTASAERSQRLYGRNTQVTLYYREGRYQEARELGLQLIEQAREKLGPKHPGLTVMLANVGFAEQKLRLYPEAADCFREAVAIDETVNSRDPYLAKLLSSYATVLKQAHHKPEAKKVELRAKAILAGSVH